MEGISSVMKYIIIMTKEKDEYLERDNDKLGLSTKMRG
jgi:hypothetical protein